MIPFTPLHVTTYAPGFRIGLNLPGMTPEVWLWLRECELRISATWPKLRDCDI